MRNVRVGFVGVGKMGQCAHLRNYAQISDCEVVALAELRENLGRRVAARYGVPAVYSDWEEMVAREKPDALVVSQPFNRHAVLVPKLLKAGIPLFIEKPLAVTVETGKKLVEAVRESGTWVMVGYHKRSDPATILAKEQIEKLNVSGELGRMTYIRIVMPAGEWIAGGFDDLIEPEGEPLAGLECEPPPGEMDENSRKTYLHVINYYIHQINMLRHMLGEPYRVTYADPSGILLVARSEGGVVCALEMSAYRTTVEWQESVLVTFQKGYVKVELPAPLARHRPGRVELLRDPGKGSTPVLERPHLPWVDAMRQQAAHFVAAVRGEQRPACDAREALEDLVAARDYVRLLADG